MKLTQQEFAEIIDCLNSFGYHMVGEYNDYDTQERVEELIKSLLQKKDSIVES